MLHLFRWLDPETIPPPALKNEKQDHDCYRNYYRQMMHKNVSPDIFCLLALESFQVDDLINLSADIFFVKGRASEADQQCSASEGWCLL